MSDNVYKDLIGALAMRGGAAPAFECPELYELLEELYTPEEAKLACQMPVGAVSTADLASSTGRDLEEVERLIDSMCNKGLAIGRPRGGVDVYSILQIMPGIFEYQFMKGEVNDRTKKLARLFEDYLNLVYKMAEEVAEKGYMPQAYPFTRVLAVEEEISGGTEVQPYDRVSHYIDSAQYIAVSQCYCRHHGELLGRPCDKPKEVCLTFGPGAKFNVDRGFARPISKEEARRILDLAEEEGLVHCSTNMGKHVDFICNCCVCHCPVLQTIKSSIMPNGAAFSPYMVMVDEAGCMGCGDCIERCQMEALILEGDIVVRDAGRCIGCGICVSSCAPGALSMVPRLDRPQTPWDRQALNAAMEAAFKLDPSSS
jgi:Pyruvate/2-oxoacid:ferredoxin oxidoreductase delta subunit